ncbi:Flp pilus assembly complex ATPase component TadA [Aerococcaceae bacterium zg-B36]|uniref:competence type IV pilus ATPase ComGA n=1 Tax=Aerococcaceae bacterium zg-252 TaxID=2796928 RepID=UPI001BD89656|nr:Flp pilus assembly complex ATPase component TadA [Aerococcaceae bacterium zg-B36]
MKSAIEEDVQQLIKDAVESNVSDIHLLPVNQHYVLYFRQFGKMAFYAERALDWGKKLISYLKFLANLDVGEKRKPQSGAIHYQMAIGQIELRLSTITNIDLIESLVIRVIHQKKHEQNNMNVFFPNDVMRLKRLVQRKSGLILFSGPVGSGKTTTIYHLLRNRMADETLQIITMEDPVEIIEPQFLQTEVNYRAGVSYEQLIKAALRHHPDILLIGEIRDEETAKMVIRGALTGHLMIATIHAKNTLGVIGRLQELSVTTQQIQQTLIGIVSQRLIPSFQEQRYALFEILEGKALYAACHQQPMTFRTLNQRLRKAWANGYLSTKSYYQFEII